MKVNLVKLNDVAITKNLVVPVVHLENQTYNHVSMQVNCMIYVSYLKAHHWFMPTQHIYIYNMRHPLLDLETLLQFLRIEF